MKRDDVVEAWREDMAGLEECEPVITSVRDINNLILYIDEVHEWIQVLIGFAPYTQKNLEELRRENHFLSKKD